MQVVIRGVKDKFTNSPCWRSCLAILDAYGNAPMSRGLLNFERKENNHSGDLGLFGGEFVFLMMVTQE